MAEVWVVNSSPLIVLAKVGQLELLKAGDRQLVIPEAVRDEVLRGPPDIPHGKRFSPALMPAAAVGYLIQWYSSGDWAVAKPPF